MEISYNFYKGFNSVFNFDIAQINKYKSKTNYDKENYLALKGDWENVGRDIRNATIEYRHKTRRYE